MDRDDRDLVARLQAEIRRSRALAETTAWLAGQVARVEDDLATTLEYMANLAPARADKLLAKAMAARAFAARERQEQLRWQGVSDAQ